MATVSKFIHFPLFVVIEVMVLPAE